jgi:hypothetical protein
MAVLFSESFEAGTAGNTLVVPAALQRRKGRVVSCARNVSSGIAP